MLTLFTLAEKLASHVPAGHWYELAPGPDDGQHWAPDGAFIRMDEWEWIVEPLLGDRLRGYDRHGRTNADAATWAPVLAYLGDVAHRLRTADEPAMLHVLLPELDGRLRGELVRGFPSRPIELASGLDDLAGWIAGALKRWHSVTIIGL